MSALHLPLRINLVQNGCTLSVEEAMSLLNDVKAIFAPAGFDWEALNCERVVVPEAALRAAAPNDPSAPPGRQRSCELLAQHPAYDPEAINLFWVSTLPFFTGSLHSAGEVFKNQRILIAVQQFMKDQPAKCLARTLAVFLGAASTARSEPQRLMTLNSPGVELNADEARDLRRQAEKLASVLSAPAAAVSAQLPLTLALHLVRNSRHGCNLSLAEGQAMLVEVARIWAPAGVRIEGTCREVELPEAALEQAFPNGPGDTTRRNSYQALMAGAGYQPQALNVFYLKEVRDASGQQRFGCSLERSARSILVGTDPPNPPARAVARALGVYLELPFNEYVLPDRLMGTMGGTRFSQADVSKARQQLLAWLPPASPPSPPASPLLQGDFVFGAHRLKILRYQGSEFNGLEFSLSWQEDGCLVSVRHLLMLNGSEVDHLLGLLQEGQVRAGSLQPGTQLRLGGLPPQSLDLRISLLRLSGTSPADLMFILRRHERSWILSLPLLQVPMLATALMSARALSRMLAPECAPRVLRVGSGTGPQSLEDERGELWPWVAAPGILTGPDGEVLELQHLQAGDEVRIWPWKAGMLRAQALRAQFCNASLLEQARAGRPGALHDLGQRADRLQGLGQLDLAESLYRQILELRPTNQFLLAKLALGMMLARARDLDGPGAYAIWMSPPEEPLGEGVAALEEGVLGSHDYILFKLICSWLYALGPTPAVAVDRVTFTMDRVCQHLASEPGLLKLALGHWRLHLLQLFPPPRTPDPAAHEPYVRHCQAAGGEQQTILDFPQPDAWLLNPLD